ncbi:MAG: glycosyltransferase family 4 protein [Anaerolineae bacterium]|nr:glycosyltransferase family 4 protein [Anaerolineae bacterium]
MHIALNGWFWDQPYSGSGQYLRGLLLALLRLPDAPQVTLILPHASADPLPEGVTVLLAPPRLGGHLGKVWFEQRAFPAMVRRSGADLAHVPYWGPPLSSPVPLVVSVLDVISLALPEYRGGLLAGLYTSLIVAGARGANHILTLSAASQAEVETHLNIPTKQITFTWLAVDERYTPRPDPQQDAVVRQKYGLPEDFALYFGGYDVRKNVNTLLLAWTYAGPALGEGVPLVLAGKPPAQWGGPRFPDLPAYARALNIEKYVQWLGVVDEADKPALYRAARVMAWPSLYEGFGLPLLEAMACGTPVVASHVPATRELVGDAGYLVEPENAREMGGALLALMGQDDLHQQQTNLVHGRATQFSWRKTAQQTLAVYQQVLAETGR